MLKIAGSGLRMRIDLVTAVDGPPTLRPGWPSTQRLAVQSQNIGDTIPVPCHDLYIRTFWGLSTGPRCRWL